MHGLNGDILVWNPVTRRRHELSSMGIRVNKRTLVQQLEMTGPIHFLNLPYHQAIMDDQIPLSIGGGIGQARTSCCCCTRLIWAKSVLRFGPRF